MQQMIVYEDRELLVLHKPAGLAVESASVTSPDVASMLKSYLKTTYIGLVHRLDQPVEGLFVVAKTKAAAAGLTKQLGTGELVKSYQVLAHDETQGGFKDGEFELRDYILKNGAAKKAQIVSADTRDAKGKKAAPAILRGRVLERRDADVLCCRIGIETGRFHQIRVQMSHAHLPLLGDRKYGSESCLMLTNELGIKQLALCADRLSFIHPKSGEQMEFSILPFWAKKDA